MTTTEAKNRLPGPSPLAPITSLHGDVDGDSEIGDADQNPVPNQGAKPREW